MNTLEFVILALLLLLLIWSIGGLVNLFWPVGWRDAEKPPEAPTAATPGWHTGVHE